MRIFSIPSTTGALSMGNLDVSSVWIETGKMKLKGNDWESYVRAGCVLICGCKSSFCLDWFEVIAETDRF